MSKNIRKLLVIFFIGGIVVSCAPTKNSAYIRYSQEVESLNSPDKVYIVDNDSSNIIKAGDELYITVGSGNDEPNSFNQSAGSNRIGGEMMGYRVDDNGIVRLPYLKQVKVDGMSIQQLTDTLESELSQYLYLPAVSIRVINNRISILGEVNSPGLYLFNRKSLNIYQALAYAGDIAPFGNRKKVMIIRQEGDEIVKKYVDLLNDEIIGSTWYMVKAEDIIYVEPLGRKKWGMETFSVFSWLSLITTLVLTYTLLTGNTLTSN